MPDEDPSPSAAPSWKDVLQFVHAEADEQRKVIDFWFKLAGRLLGLIIVAASVGRC
jgi:hypothetical protein